MRVAVLVVPAALVMTLAAAFASACGGSSGPSSGEKTASAESTATVVAVTTQAEALTALVLQPSDVPAGMPHTEGFGNEYGEVVSYSVRYGDDGFSIASSVGRAAPGKTIDQFILRTRQLQSSLYKPENNYTLDGADQGFVYGNPRSNAIATLILKDGYYVNVVISTTDKARIPEVQDTAALDRYTKIVFDRLKAYLADPSSVTPAAGAPPYAAPTATAVTAATPQPTGTGD